MDALGFEPRKPNGPDPSILLVYHNMSIEIDGRGTVVFMNKFKAFIIALAMMPLYLTLMLLNEDYDNLIEWWKTVAARLLDNDNYEPQFLPFNSQTTNK